MTKYTLHEAYATEGSFGTLSLPSNSDSMLADLDEPMVDLDDAECWLTDESGMRENGVEFEAIDIPGELALPVAAGIACYRVWPGREQDYNVYSGTVLVRWIVEV